MTWFLVSILTHIMVLNTTNQIWKKLHMYLLATQEKR